MVVADLSGRFWKEAGTASVMLLVAFQISLDLQEEACHAFDLSDMDDV